GEPGRRQMAFAAGRDVAVAALLPRVVELVHHVAVDARLRVGRQVREPFGVAEREGPDAERDADPERQQETPAEGHGRGGYGSVARSVIAIRALLQHL